MGRREGGKEKPWANQQPIGFYFKNYGNNETWFF